MKIHFTIEIEEDTKPLKVRLTPPKSETVKIAEVAPEPILPEPEPQARAPICKPNSGPSFDPGFLKIIQDAVEPFTRRSISIASGVSVTDVTLRLNRMMHKGWIEQPAFGLWRKTKSFGRKNQ